MLLIRGPDVLDLRSSSSSFGVKHILTLVYALHVGVKKTLTYGQAVIRFRVHLSGRYYTQISPSRSDEDAYRFLPHLAFMLQCSNPGSVVALSTDENDVFRYFFVSLAAFSQGWPHCRPVIVVDGSFLKATFRGMLLTACVTDANE
ncbi:hypothetical protein TorRG33x02_133760 [Trema orientale]|uniref:MULE transposase domain-containing protein n=1 Tax=Trema orientale TaxID=63057 RepID=A0A2P5EYX7_TREOI|nr:hypothetical protein TorRG33x02_133760 [Trema orientale]